MDVITKLKNFLVKLQNLPETQKKAILWTIVAVIGLTGGYFWFRGALDNFSRIEKSAKLVNVPIISLPSENILQTTTPNNGNPTAQTSSDQTADWQTYINNKYGYQINYPSDWVVDVNLLSQNNMGEGDGVFCPPELQYQNNINGNVGCKVGKTNGGSIAPEAPISLFQCDPKSDIGTENCQAYKGVNLGIDQDGKYFYKLVISDQKYLATYNQMIKTFKFTTP